jgi:hypothetical protein
MKDDKKDFCFRVVIRFHDSLWLRHQEKREKTRRLMPFDPLTWRHLNKIVRGKKVTNLFTSLNPETIETLICKAVKSDPTYQPLSFFDYYSVGCDSDSEAKEIVERLAEQDVVDLTYIETHSATPPSVHTQSNPLSLYQGYLNPAPAGIDAKYAWEFPGGNGGGNVGFIDIEQGWKFNHEDISVHQLPTTGRSHWQHEDHGAAVLGVIMMQDNQVGGIGITPEANGYVISQWRPDGTFNTADAIMAAIGHLKFGDIMLLEAQSYDVLNTRQIWPIEILDANFQAIRLATALGIVVVEAAGNGMYRQGNNLDLFRDRNGAYSLNRASDSFMDSGAIVVGAASGEVPHVRINASNYGNRVDCFAWGNNVVTAGRLPRWSAASTNCYTAKFGGTSSASAIIAGAAIAMQCIAEAKYGTRLGPIRMRDILSNQLYGTASLNGHKIDKIGVMPDLRKIIDQALNFIPLPKRGPVVKGQNKPIQKKAIAKA